MLKKAIIGTLVRRLLGYLGVGAVVGLQDDLGQLAGLTGAALTLAWSIYEKMKAARANKAGG